MNNMFNFVWAWMHIFKYIHINYIYVYTFICIYCLHLPAPPFAVTPLRKALASKDRNLVVKNVTWVFDKAACFIKLKQLFSFALMCSTLSVTAWGLES